jgi:hypothetical protein
MAVKHTCTNQCDGCDTWCVEPDKDAVGLAIVEEIFDDIRDRRFLKWLFDRRGDQCLVGKFDNGEELRGIDLEAQGQIKAAWQVIIARAIAARVADLEAKLDTANALVTCCCGSPVDTHGMGDGHSPVDMYHYAHTRLTEENERLKNLLRLADEALMLSHMGFPLDRVTKEQRYLNDAAKAIRSVTGDDFEKRKASAAIALGRAR